MSKNNSLNIWILNDLDFRGSQINRSEDWNVFQYLYFLHMYPYLYILFSYHIFHSAYSSSISYFLLSWLYNDLNNAVINGDFPEDYLFWISCVDSKDGKEGMLDLETLMKYCNLRNWGGGGLIWHLGLGSSYFLMGGGGHFLGHGCLFKEKW